MSITAILLKYSNGDISLEEANKALAEEDAGFFLNPANAEGGWTEAEMAEGFRPGKPAEVRPAAPDMSRRNDLAGQTVMQQTKTATYAVSYDEDGYAVKAVKQ